MSVLAEKIVAAIMYSSYAEWKTTTVTERLHRVVEFAANETLPDVDIDECRDADELNKLEEEITELMADCRIEVHASHFHDTGTPSDAMLVDETVTLREDFVPIMITSDYWGIGCHDPDFVIVGMVRGAPMTLILDGVRLGSRVSDICSRMGIKLDNPLIWVLSKDRSSRFGELINTIIAIDSL